MKIFMDDLSIILPVYNERDSIERVLNEWHKLLRKYKFSFHYIICEDGSTDGTAQLLRSLRKKYPIILNQRSQRRGYSKAILDGILTAKSEYILCIDSDGQCNPGDFHKFWKKKEKAQVLIGNRIKRIDDSQRKLFSALFKFFFRVLFPNSISDPSAPFVLFKKKTIYPYLRFLNFLREGFWWGFMAVCLKMNLEIMEIPINHRRRILGDTQIYTFGEIPGIALRNSMGLVRLKFAK